MNIYGYFDISIGEILFYSTSAPEFSLVLPKYDRSKSINTAHD